VRDELVDAGSGSSPATGTCSERFEEVRREFERNFTERGELGSAVCVVHDGQIVVDLVGGSVDARRRRAWQPDTIVCVFSCTKGATALCAHLLAAAGELDLERPVAYYWPEFGRNGKDAITVRMLLGHQGGVPGLSAPVELQTVLDFDAIAGRLMEERPLWAPGSRHGYHVMTFGWLVGELIRRVGGASVGAFFAEHIAGPMGLDFWIGLPDDEAHRVADVVMARAASSPMGPQFDAAVVRGDGPPLAASHSLSRLLDPTVLNSASTRAAELPGIGGIANARSLARMYAPLSRGGEAPIDVLSEQDVARMAAVESACAVDAVLLQPTRYSLGFEKGIYGGYRGFDQPNGLRLSEAAFGHSGLGGSVGFADPRLRISFGYVTNYHADPVSRDTRSQRLIDATYRAVGCRARSDGGWM
jgi:CubicO group peptidase (beta-lactamase class C family)